jgi:chromosome partitioning protein
MSPRIISVVNHKGGVFKTTVTTNLGAALALAGKKVLVIDFDPQQDLTASLIGQKGDDYEGPNLCDAILDEQSLDDLIEPTTTPRLHIIPTTEEFFTLELSLVNAVGREYYLRTCLEKTERLKEYDIVLIDNSPSIGLVTMNALCASDLFLVPVKAEFLPMKGLTLLGNSIGRLQKLAPQLKPLGVVITNFSASEVICRQVEGLLRKQLGDNCLQTKIRINTKAKAAPSVRKTVFEYEANPQGRSTEDFTALADEVLARLGMTRSVPEPDLRIGALNTTEEILDTVANG